LSQNEAGKGVLVLLNKGTDRSLSHSSLQYTNSKHFQNREKKGKKVLLYKTIFKYKDFQVKRCSSIMIFKYNDFSRIMIFVV